MTDAILNNIDQAKGSSKIEIDMINIEEHNRISKEGYRIELALNNMEKSLILEVTNARNEILEVNSIVKKKIAEVQAELEEANATKAEFLNNISHEIKTPVTGFLAISEGLVNLWHNLDEQNKHKYIKDIAGSAKKLAYLVSNLHDLSKLTSGNIVLELEEIDLNRSVDDIIKECLLLYLNDKNLELKFDNYAKNSKLIGDYARIEQILHHLFVNSIKFSPENSEISSYLNEVKLNYGKREVSGLYFKIRDQGVGIPDSELEMIFEAFTQSSRTKTRAGGVGIGLAIAKEIIEAHHGKIWATNNQEKGATFHLLIPLNYDMSLESKSILSFLENSKELVKINQEINYHNTKPLTILMIDDDSFCLSSMELIIKQLNHNLITTSGGVEGLKYLNENADKIDLVLLDLMMPDIYGLEVLAKIKENPLTAHIPVILQSGTIERDEIDKAYKLGIIANLLKPYQSNRVFAAIEKAKKIMLYDDL